MIIHLLSEGQTPCEMEGLPCDWPPGHQWASAPEDVNCHKCLERIGNVKTGKEKTNDPT